MSRRRRPGNERPSNCSVRRHAQRRGIMLVLAAALIVVVAGLVAFAIDLGYVATVKTELQRTADAAAFAGAGALVNGTATARKVSETYLSTNRAGGSQLSSKDATIDFGYWDANAKSFVVSEYSPSAVRVVATSAQQPFFFGRLFGKNNFTSQAQAIAQFQPRDIVLVLDYSGSMCFDSQFHNLGLLGQPAVEANLTQMYHDMGSPSYGSLTWTPVLYGTTSTSSSTVLKNFHLDTVAYPYPAGSWSEFVTYVQTDSYVNSAGYRCKYGYMTWLNYLQAKRGSYHDTPVLWNTSEQPVTALKDAVDVFLSYLQAHSTDDHVGLSLYVF